MKFFGFLRKKREIREVKEGKYVLLFRPKGSRGWIPIDSFEEPIDEETAESMEYFEKPGLYMLQDKTGGGFGKPVWKKRVEGEEEGEEEMKFVGRKTESDVVAQAIENDMLRAVRWFKLPAIIQEAAKKAFQGIPLSGGGVTPWEAEGKSFEDWFMEQQKKMRERFKEMAEIYGYVPASARVGESDKIPVKGEIPAWFVYAPDFVDKMLQRFEDRLKRWGMIETKEVKTEMPEFPDIKKYVEEGKRESEGETG